MKSKNYINNARANQGDTSIYYGITTKSILSEVEQFDGDSGEALRSFYKEQGAVRVEELEGGAR